MAKEPKAYRLSPDVVELINALRTKCTPNFTHSQAGIIEIAIRELAASRSVAVGQPARKKKGGAK